MEVTGLFSNTPARKKFLRTNRTELSHIDDIVKDYCLARPDVTFILKINGRETIHLEKQLDLPARLASLHNYSGEFIEVQDSSTGQDGISVAGLLVPPESSAPIAARLRLFVNGRAIRDRMLAHAVNEGLRSFVLKGRTPAGMIRVDLPPESIDINVHPAKHEVRFKDSRVVHQRVCDAVRDSMIKHQQVIRHEVFSYASSTSQPANRISEQQIPEKTPPPCSNHFEHYSEISSSF